MHDEDYFHKNLVILLGILAFVLFFLVFFIGCATSNSVVKPNPGNLDVCRTIVEKTAEQLTRACDELVKDGEADKCKVAVAKTECTDNTSIMHIVIDRRFTTKSDSSLGSNVTWCSQVEFVFRGTMTPDLNIKVEPVNMTLLKLDICDKVT